MRALARHSHSTSTKALTLDEDHPAMLEMRSLFSKSANEAKRPIARALVSGFNSRKIGKVVTKGKLKGFPIYTLTLEERRTCPTDCAMLRSCYGNRMPWSIRWPANQATLEKIGGELRVLQVLHPKGFLVRLHVLGDFYSVEYVHQWSRWIDQFPALHAFGFTARHGDPIADAIAQLAWRNWDRFAIRSSEGREPALPAALVRSSELEVAGIRCPVETQRTATCGTCALCWSAPGRTIVFSPH